MAISDATGIKTLRGEPAEQAKTPAQLVIALIGNRQQRGAQTLDEIKSVEAELEFRLWESALHMGKGT